MIPLHDRVVIKRNDVVSQTISGIVLPESAKDIPQKGIVLAVGPGKFMENGKLCPMTVKPGDEILFGQYSGTDIDLDGQKVLIMCESDVLAITKEGKPDGK